MTRFPDVRWGSDANPLRGPLTAVARTRVGSWLVRTATPLDRRVLERTGGRITLLGPIGAPTVLLETVGARTGRARTSPLLYVRDRTAAGERLIVVGSNFGQGHHPAWTANLRAHPDATVIMGGRRIAVRAEQLTGAEAERAYARMIELVDVYAAYRRRTTRDIRVFALTAVE